MSGQLVYDLVLPQVLINYVRTFDNEVLRNVFVLEQFLPNRFVDDLEFRIRQGTISDTETAEYRAWDTPPPMTGRAGITRIRGELAPISRQIPMGEEEFLRLRALERGTNEPIISAIYDDSEKMIRSVQARIELARGGLLSTGKTTINENGLVLEAHDGLDRRRPRQPAERPAQLGGEVRG
jgi:Phage major capsid protein E